MSSAGQIPAYGREKGLHFVFKASKGSEGKGKTEIISTNTADLQCKKENGALRKYPQIAPGEV